MAGVVYSVGMYRDSRAEGERGIAKAGTRIPPSSTGLSEAMDNV